MDTVQLKDGSVILCVRAEVADIPELIAIEQSVAGPRVYSAMLTHEEWVEEMEKGTVFLLRKGDNAVGNFSFEEKSPEHFYISGFALKPEFQGQGIARAVMQEFLNTHTTERIDLITHPDNTKAVQLYTSLGFFYESRIENYFGDGEPRVVMACKR